MATKRVFIDEFRNGQTVDQVFLVRDKELRTTKNGDQFMRCTLADRTGTIACVMWRVTESVFQGIPVEGYLQAKGRVEDYRGSLQMTIDACRPIAADRVETADFIPVSQHDPEEMWSELLEILRAIKNKPLRLLIKKFVEDVEFVAAFKRAPAAMQMHNPYVGGLLEHTLMIARAAQAVLPLYPHVNADLLLAGIFFHDMGKTAELSSGPTFNYTDRGQLVGHITMAAIWIEQKAAEVTAQGSEEFPRQTLNLLQHLVLSHHGVYEYGSPKLPATPEAFMLHFLDNLDAKMYITQHAIEADSDPESSFTAYLREIETRVYKNSNALE